MNQVLRELLKDEFVGLIREDLEVRKALAKLIFVDCYIEHSGVSLRVLDGRGGHILVEASYTGGSARSAIEELRKR